MTENRAAEGRRLVTEYVEAEDALREMLRPAVNLSAGEIPVPTAIDRQYLVECDRREELRGAAFRAWRRWLSDPIG